LGAISLVRPSTSWWVPFGLVVIANLYFSVLDVASLSLLGDIVDYGKLKFRKDRGATYFALNLLIFKFGLGIGGGLALAIVGWFGFDPSATVNSMTAIFGLKFAFSILPACFALLALVLILRTPIDKRRHGVIRRRIESRLVRDASRPGNQQAITLASFHGRGHVANQSAAG
jgi:glycoside/pentoside/hexuronide:cation symporter, GPH family